MKKILNHFTFKLILMIVFIIVLSLSIYFHLWVMVGISAVILTGCVILLVRHNSLNYKRVNFMLNAIESEDYSFKFVAKTRWGSDTEVTETLNRITKLLKKAKEETVEKERYYELILNHVKIGIISYNDKGFVFQTNSEALRLLGLPVFTHLKQLNRVDENLYHVLDTIANGEKKQAAITNERGTINLSLHAIETLIQDKNLRIVAINDINNELEDKEIESWMRLTRVMTHEIMNSITPITSLSETLLTMHREADEEIRKGLKIIQSTGKGLISFVESYRKFTRVPTPEPKLFYVKPFIERNVQLSEIIAHHISIEIKVQPEELLLYADENLIGQVVLNLLKNAVQAIGNQENGKITIDAYTNSNEEIIIEVGNNGPEITPEMADHIFVPFFTTKEGGSGIGLSISRQIMRLSGGSISLKTNHKTSETTFVLTFR